MIDDIIDAVSKRLGGAFGDRYRIYKDDVTQGLLEPCFFISAKKASIKPMPSRRYYCVNKLGIRYYPEDKGNNGEMLRAAVKMADALEYITLLNNIKLRGTAISYSIKDANLMFEVNYNLFISKTEDTEFMETLDVIKFKSPRGI